MKLLAVAIVLILIQFLAEVEGMGRGKAFDIRTLGKGISGNGEKEEREEEEEEAKTIDISPAEADILMDLMEKIRTPPSGSIRKVTRSSMFMQLRSEIFEDVGVFVENHFEGRGGDHGLDHGLGE